MAIEEFSPGNVDEAIIVAGMDSDNEPADDAVSALSDKRRMDFRRRIEDRLEERRLREELGLDEDDWLDA